MFYRALALVQWIPQGLFSWRMEDCSSWLQFCLCHTKLLSLGAQFLLTVMCVCWEGGLAADPSEKETTLTFVAFTHYPREPLPVLLFPQLTGLYVGTALNTSCFSHNSTAFVQNDFYQPRNIPLRAPAQCSS